MSTETDTKTCSTCGRVLPDTNEYFAPGRNQCRTCRRERETEWRKANRERHNATRRAYAAAHREDIRAYDRKWREEHPERPAEYYRIALESHPEQVLATRRAYYERAKDQIMAKVRAWQKANPERYSESQRKSRRSHPDTRRANDARRRARKRGNEACLNAEDIKAQYAAQEGKCFYCGADLPADYHVDHFVPLVLGGPSKRENIRIACPSCNTSKSTKHPSEFLKLSADT